MRWSRRGRDGPGGGLFSVRGARSTRGDAAGEVGTLVGGLVVKTDAAAGGECSLSVCLSALLPPNAKTSRR